MEKGIMENISNSDVRVNNRKRLVNVLFHQGEMTKQELVKNLNISLATVNFLVKELTEKGLLTTGSAQQSTGGRKPVCVKPVYSARYSCGAEAAKDMLRVVILDLGANIVARKSYRIQMENTLEYWQKVGELIRNFISENNISEDILLDTGITLGLTMKDEELISRKSAHNEIDIDLDLAREGVGFPVHFRNSTKMAALANYWSENDQENFVYVYLGLKISAAYMHDGIMLDFTGVNGELGCMLLSGPEDPSGKRRLDDVFSREVICRETNTESLDEFFEKCESDASCKAYLDGYLEELAKLLHNLYCIFGWKIVIGGSVSPYLANYIETLREKMREKYPFTEMKEDAASVCALAGYGAATGAAMLAIDKFLEFGVNEEL